MLGERTKGHTKIGAALAVICCVIFGSGSVLADSPNDLIIVVNKGIPISKISIDELRAVFLKKRIIWPTGGKIVPFNDQPGSRARKRFSQIVLDMPHEQELRYWQDQAVKHGKTAPQIVTSAGHARLRKVFTTQWSITYVLRRDFLEGVVKQLLIIPAGD